MNMTKPMKWRMCKDPELNRLASELSTLSWNDPLSPEEWNELQRAAMLPPHIEGSIRHHLYAMPGFKFWAVRLYLGGETRVMGHVSTQQLPVGLRFADMAAMYFWKYRVRGACEPSESELNRAVDDVKSDLVHETAAVALLQRIESHLLKIGAILSPEKRQKLAMERKAKNRGGLRAQIAGNQAELLEYCGAISESLVQTRAALTSISRAVEAGFAKQEEAFRLLVGALQSIEKKLDQRTQ